MGAQSAGQVWRGQVTRVLGDGQVWVVVPQLMGSEPLGPMPSHGATSVGARVLLVLLGGSRQSMIVIPESGDGSNGGGSHLDVDRTVGTRVKLPDSGGDVVLLAATGIRNITASWDKGMPGAPTYSQAWIYREGDSVTLMLNLVKDGGSTLKYLLPTGFRPSTATLVTTSAYTRLDSKSVLMQISGGAIYGVYNQEAPMDEYSDIVGQWTWHTSDPWPAILPGMKHTSS